MYVKSPMSSQLTIADPIDRPNFRVVCMNILVQYSSGGSSLMQVPARTKFGVHSQAPRFVCCCLVSTPRRPVCSFHVWCDFFSSGAIINGIKNATTPLRGINKVKESLRERKDGGQDHPGTGRAGKARKDGAKGPRAVRDRATRRRHPSDC